VTGLVVVVLEDSLLVTGLGGGRWPQSPNSGWHPSSQYAFDDPLSMLEKPGSGKT
jgi:hypothetical protein